ncbi:unnamed protein product [Oppiella nova]|uniref:C2H2-type domain-containing protein n=1 Tax=Oppiella nova TaxID=334625 RepID=A0A7R9LL85_9ACAR|nr:unnamed protein product [Oppiella nova]CAG2164088.1 unnamed protein product [Oppiella nova]
MHKLTMTFTAFTPISVPLDVIMDSNDNDFSDLKTQYKRLCDELAFERQLNHILDTFKSYSLVLINRCKCETNRQIVDQLNQFSDQYASLKSRQSGQQNGDLLSDPEIGDRSGDTSVDIMYPKVEIQESTDPSVTHTCSECEQQFASELDLQIHMNSVHKEDLQLYTCDECREVFTSDDLFATHMRDNHGFSDTNTGHSDDMHASDDNKIYNETIAIKQVITHVANKPFTLLTVFTYGSLCPLEIHSNKYHKNLKPFVCIICKESFFANLSLLNHLSQKHRISAFECDSCDYKTRTKHHLIQHKVSHSMDKPFKCPFDGCEKSFKRKFRLINHKIMHLNQFMCHECHEDFKDNATLLSHLSHKHKLSVFECHLCDYKTRNRHHLIRHTVIHSTDTTPHFSAICLINTNSLYLSAIYTRNRHHLIRHTVIHSTDRPFVCRFDGCDLTFKRKDYLLRHEKLH